MYHFEGQYRRTPIQSLRGASKKEEKNLLLQRNQAERKKREDHRKQLTSAVIIQSFYRGCKVRQIVKDEQRHQFDTVVQTDQKSGLISSKTLETILPQMWRKLLFFFNNKQDGSRLNWFCQLCIKHQTQVLQMVCKNLHTGLYDIQNLLWLCCKHLETVAAGGQPLAVPLRMLEIYTLPRSYTQHISVSQSEHFVHRVLSFLIKKGYYKCMRVLIEQKVPSTIDHTARAPTPMAGSVLELLRKPLTIVTHTQNISLRNEVLQFMCQELFCQPHTEQIKHFILPALSQTPESFPFPQLLEALVVVDINKPNKPDYDIQLSVDCSLWLLHAVLVLGEKQIDKLTDASMSIYLKVLHKLCGYLEPPRSKSQHLQKDDDSDEEPMDIDNMSSDHSVLAETQQDCLTLLDQPNLVKSMLRCIEQYPTEGHILAVCSVCHVLMAYRKQAIHTTRLLYSLTFSPWFLRSLWQTCRSVCTGTVTGSKMALLQLLSGGLTVTPEHQAVIVPLLSVFSSLFSHSLFSLHDAEFYGESEGSHIYMPFEVYELVPMSQALRDACLGIIELAHPDSKHALRTSYKTGLHKPGTSQRVITEEDMCRQLETWAYLFKVLSQLVKQFYSRDSRRMFCPPGHWLASRVNIMAANPSQIYHIESEAFQRRPFASRSALNPRRQVEDEGPPMSTTEVRNITVLTEMPFVVSFEERVKILQKLLNLDHSQHQGEARLFSVGPMINITVRRAYLYEDAFEKLSPENEPNMQMRMQVHLKNFQDLDEAGIDGGGIFREFMNELIKTAFDPNRGFFKYTNDKTLYPNPQAQLLVQDYTKHYFFLGRILGKALYENMLVELPFASFFLNKILSRRGGDVDIHHLASLDPEMYKNLLFLKDYEGDVSDLGLDFTVVNNDLGETQIEDLKPGGGDIPVTSHNRIEYIHLMADYRLNKQIRVHCHAFRQGLADVINIDWLRMFDHNELQVLIAGAPVPIDIGDLRRHTNYSGGYNEEHPTVHNFWRVVQEFSDKQKRQLLKFVTSCSRPPLLGFKDLYPAFCVQCGGTEGDRLPSASTCMNLLKLPDFKTEETLKRKLLYAIESGAGFELS